MNYSVHFEGPIVKSKNVTFVQNLTRDPDGLINHKVRDKFMDEH